MSIEIQVNPIRIVPILGEPLPVVKANLQIKAQALVIKKPVIVLPRFSVRKRKRR